MASLNPENLLQLKFFSGDGMEPNCDFVNPERPRTPFAIKGARGVFGVREPTFLFITARWHSSCVSPRLYRLSSVKGLTQEQLLKHPCIHLDALRAGRVLGPGISGKSPCIDRAYHQHRRKLWSGRASNALIFQGLKV